MVATPAASRPMAASVLRCAGRAAGGQQPVWRFRCLASLRLEAVQLSHRSCVPLENRCGTVVLLGGSAEVHGEAVVIGVAARCEHPKGCACKAVAGFHVAQRRSQHLRGCHTRC